MLAGFLIMIKTEEGRKHFEQIYKKYSQRMVAYAFQLLKDQGHAEDVVQDIVMAIIKNGAERVFAIDEAHLWGYLAAAVRNRCSTFYKKHADVQETEFDDQRALPQEDDLHEAETYAHIVNTIRAMPETYADVLYYSLIDGLPAPQIALLLGLKPDAVRQRLVRGKKLLREALGEDIEL